MALENIVLLVGGVGGAKLAYGLKQILAPKNLTVIVNTGDDFWLYGLRICPDLDTIMYTLAGLVDRRNGWGIANDTVRTLQGLQRYGEDTWFRLGDHDLATHMLRTNWLHEGRSLSDVTAQLSSALGLEHRILPMTDDEVATIIHTAEYGDLPFQTYFVRHRWQPVLVDLRYEGAASAQMTAAVADAISKADAIILGPSNPWLSILPILSVPGMRAALTARNVPRVAVSPIVGGQAIKGPTAKIMREMGLPQTAAQVATTYGDLINGFIYDHQDAPLDIPSMRTEAAETVMRSDRDKIALAEVVLNWISRWEKV